MAFSAWAFFWMLHTAISWVLQTTVFGKYGKRYGMRTGE